MKIYFNSLGVVTNFETEQADSLRQGSVGNKITAIFDGIIVSDCIPTLNFTRSDGSIISNVGMDIVDANKCELVFDDPWYFALAGNATMTIFLHDGSGNVVAQGQHLIAIESSDYDPSAVPPVTQEEYNYLLAQLASKLNKSGVSQLGESMSWYYGGIEVFSYENGAFTFHLPVSFASLDAQAITINNQAVATEAYVQSELIPYATEAYVQEQISAIVLTPYETKVDATAKYNELNGKINNVREVAEGKCKSYTISVNDNASFNTQDSSISEVLSITDISGNTIQVSSLKNGDVVLVIETEVPDRWYSASDGKFYNLETAKVDLSDYYNKTQVDEAIANSLSYGGFNTISDANNAELNKFYWIANQTANFPNNDSKVGLLMNMGYSSTYRTQIYISGYGTNAPEYYVRNIVGTSWSNWYQLAREEGLLRNTRQSYDTGPSDADNAVNNTFICVVGKTTNYPYANASGFLYTNYSLADDKYGIQMFISRTTSDVLVKPTIYVRSKNNNVFYKWHKLAIEGNPTIQLSMFKSIAACGDSYTAGYSVDKDGTIREKAFQNSWMRTLARKNGIFGGIYAKSGVTTTTWLSDSDCLPALQGDTNHYELYIILLGFNDSVSNFGTADDIDLENPLNSADTSCGNFAKIKYYIEQKDPNAKIVICKLPYGGANTAEQVNTKNPLIEACATKLGVGCASIPDFPASNDNVYKQSAHGTNVGYSYLASAIEYGVCKALAMTYYIGFSYDSSENVNKNYNAFLESLYNTASGDAANLVTESELAAALANINNINCINGSDIIDTTLTEAQFNLLKNGKPTLIVGSLFGGALVNCLINGWFTQGSSTYFRVICSTGNDNRDSCISVNTNTRKIFREYGRRTVYENVAYVNGKAIPAYPTTNTKKQVPVIAPNGGALSWEDKPAEVSAGGTGTSTTPITYITIDGVEYVITPQAAAAIPWGNITGNLADQTDLKNALDAKQNVLTFDSTPTQNSSNPVTSGGVYHAIDGVAKTHVRKVYINALLTPTKIKDDITNNSFMVKNSSGTDITSAVSNGDYDSDIINGELDSGAKKISYLALRPSTVTTKLIAIQTNTTEYTLYLIHDYLKNGDFIIVTGKYTVQQEFVPPTDYDIINTRVYYVGERRESITGNLIGTLYSFVLNGSTTYKNTVIIKEYDSGSNEIYRALYISRLTTSNVSVWSDFFGGRPRLSNGFKFDKFEYYNNGVSPASCYYYYFGSWYDGNYGTAYYVGSGGSFNPGTSSAWDTFTFTSNSTLTEVFEEI